MPKQIQTASQKQILTMTTTMHQSLAILQMSNVELEEFALKELSNNHFIEEDDISTISSESQKAKENTQTEIENVPNNTESSQSDEKNVQSETTALKSNTQNSGNSSHYDFFENIASKKSLKDYLSEQINLSFNDSRDIIIAHYLLDSLNSNGYLSINLNEAAMNLGCAKPHMNNILKVLQTFDPVGIFARDLKECLQLQLIEKKDYNPALNLVVQNLELIAKKDFKKIAKLCKIEYEDVPELIKQIQSLNPKPANGFYIEETSFKRPDVILSFNDSGDVKLEPNQECFPRLKVSEEYYVKIKGSLNSKGEKEFAKSEIETAQNLLKSIRQRSATILKVTASIVEEQIDFFLKGVMYLKPMTLNKIAVATGFNESTISRSTSNKYISTPSGIFELKYFFTSSLESNHSLGDNVSSLKAKEIIKQLILSEESDHILSDDDISKQLVAFNIRIARRTVAKYREAVGIKSSSQRKREKFLCSTK